MTEDEVAALRQQLAAATATIESLTQVIALRGQELEQLRAELTALKAEK
jgi:chromosome segregation ATPase